MASRRSHYTMPAGANGLLTDSVKTCNQEDNRRINEKRGRHDEANERASLMIITALLIFEYVN